MSLQYLAGIAGSFVDEIWVLTLHRSVDRQEKISLLLEGIPFRFFYGVDKAQLSEAALKARYQYNVKDSLAPFHRFPPLSAGEIACSLSHLEMYKALLSSSHKRILILEDDSIPDASLLPFLPSTLEQLPADIGLCYLGYTKNTDRHWTHFPKLYFYQLLASIGLGRLSVSQLHQFLPRPFSPLLWKAGFHDCTHAYIIDRSAAAILIDAQTPLRFRADNLLSFCILNQQIAAYAAKKQFFYQEIFKNPNANSLIRNTSQ